MGEIRNMTPRKFKPVWTGECMGFEQFIGVAGTFDSVAYGVTDADTTYLGRHNFKIFEDNSGGATNKRRACAGTWTLPNDYIAGSDIKITLILTGLDTTGSYQFKVGVTKRTAGGVLGTDTDTEYITITTAASSDGANYEAIASAETTFSGTGFSPGETLSIILTRDAAVDTLGFAYIDKVDISYQRESLEGESSKIIKATPVAFKPSYKDLAYNSLNGSGEATTFNTLTTVASTLGVLYDRWLGFVFDDAVNDAAVWSFMLPPDYIDGEDITVQTSMFSTATGNQVYLHKGMCKTTPGNVYSGEAGTEYIEGTTAISVVAFLNSTNTVTFDGSGFASGDLINFILVREGAPTPSTDDSNTGQLVATAVNVRIPVQAHGEVVDSNIKDMVNDLYESVRVRKLSTREGTGEAATADNPDVIDDGFDNETTTAATRDTETEYINDRYLVIRHWDGFRDSSIWPTKWPDNYIAGEDVVVEVEWTTDSSTSGTARLKGGLAKQDFIDIYLPESGTEWTTYANFAGPTAVNEVVTSSFTFTGTDLTGARKATFIFINDDLAGGSTINDNVKVLSVTFKIPVNKR